MITAHTSVLGVIGHPIEHSLSPQIQNYFARVMKQDVCYTAFHVLPEHLGKAVSGAHGLGVKGLNVTIPHKQACLPFLSRVDETARRIGAVNTLIYEKEGYAGYNTDHIGMYMALKAQGLNIRGKSVVIIGAGGTAHAACIMAADNGAAEITVSNRTLEKADLLTDHVKSIYDIPVTAVQLSKLDEIIHKDIVIQTTSVGLNDPKNGCPVESDSFFKGVSAALDLIYSPWKTKFLQMARLNGIPAVNGFPVLIYQAAAAFELWQGVTFPDGFLNQALEELESLVMTV